MSDDAKKLDLEHLRVPVIWSQSPRSAPGPVSISRSVWDKTWTSYAQRYGGSANSAQHDRLLREGFHASELDMLYPSWREECSEIATLKAEVERLTALTHCGVCGGFPNDHASDLPCICGGTGLAKDEALHAREKIARLTWALTDLGACPNSSAVERAEKAECERDAARALAERRKKALEPFVAFMARWVLPIGPMDRALSSTAWDEAKAAHDAGEEKK